MPEPLYCIRITFSGLDAARIALDLKQRGAIRVGPPESQLYGFNTAAERDQALAELRGLYGWTSVDEARVP
jgi:hypothetical protein